MNKLLFLVALFALDAGCLAQTTSTASLTKPTRALVHVDTDPLDIDRRTITIERLRPSGTRVIWIYSPGEGERRY